MNTEELRQVVDLARSVPAGRAFDEAASIDVGTIPSDDYLKFGWGRAEVAPDSGTTFAWAVAPEAGLEMFLLRTNYRSLEFRCWPMTWNGAPIQRVGVRVNGAVLGSVELEPFPKEYSVKVPKGVLQPGRNQIDLTFAYVQRPADLPREGSDQRTLAAAFDFIGFHGAPVTLDGRMMPHVRGKDLIIPRGVGFTYLLEVQGEVYLKLAAASSEGRGAAPSEAVVWSRRGDGPAHVLFSGSTKKMRGGEWSHRLEGGDGLLEIGFGAPGVADGTENPAPLELNRVRLLTSEGRAARPPNVLLVIVDTLRADHVGVYGGQTSTPNIDALAAQGVTFANAYSHIPITGPSHATLFTSRLPFEHGVHNNTQILAPGFVTMAEALKRARRTTGAVVSLGVLKGRFGFAQGFDAYLDDFGADWMKNAGEVNAELLELVDRLREPYFMWVHYSDPHEPYAPPDLDYPRMALFAGERLVAGEFATDGRSHVTGLTLRPGRNRVRFELVGEPSHKIFRFTKFKVDGPDVEVDFGRGWTEREKRFGHSTFDTHLPTELEFVNNSNEPREVELELACKLLLQGEEVRRRYALEVAYVDRQLGMMLEHLERRGLLADTLVIFAADHGESLGEHDHVGHISQLYDTLLRVPLIFSLPGRLEAGRIIDAPVGLVDVLPTVTDLLGLEPPPDASGRSLVGLMRGDGEGPGAVFAATYRPEAYSEKRAVVLDGFKYIHSWTDDRDWQELYDLTNDPGELNDLADMRPEVVARLRLVLDARLAAAKETVGGQAELSEEEISELRALGYVR